MASKRTTGRGGGGGGGGPPRPPPPRLPPFVPNTTDHNPRELRSWAKRTGFHPSTFFSGESTISSSSLASSAAPQPPPPPPPPPSSARRPPQPPELEPEPLDLETGLTAGRRRGRRRIDLRGELEIAGDGEPGFGEGNAARRREASGRNGAEHLAEDREVTANGRSRGNGVPAPQAEVKKEEAAPPPAPARKEEREAETGGYLDEYLPEPGDGGSGYGGDAEPLYRASGLRCGVAENPGWGPLIFYGIQHYLSIAGSLIFIPLILVPSMGGSDEDTATVISTVLLVSGLTTILHTFLGSRLPLIQGSSFVYLAPALVIANSEEFRNLGENALAFMIILSRFSQGAILIGSVFQIILGYSGLMSFLLRLINPVVVAPTIAAVGLAFFSYGFPQAGSCVEISMPLIVLILLFTLYMRKFSLFGNRLFLIYAVPLSVAIIWAYAFFLTAGGAYNYKGCSSNIPSSNILLDSCRRRVETMRRCRTDVSNAWRTAAWVRVPYPFQWGPPTFHFKTAIIMMIVSLVASVDSVASYHATALLVNLSPPTRGVVSRGIGLEGVSTLIAGLWGTGTGSTTLTENIHTLDATKMASRRALQLGAVLLVIFSFFGKIGALLASIPVALAASVLCFTWALIVALGLSTLRYTQAASSRNMIIVGFTLFISLSIPAYFQQYEPTSSLILPGYLLPYAAASSGPVRSGSSGLNYAVNGLLSINMVVALLVAFILDNTVPGSKQERGVYIWSDPNRLDVDPASLEPYRLPEKISCWFRWARCIGV